MAKRRREPPSMDTINLAWIKVFRAIASKMDAEAERETANDGTTKEKARKGKATKPARKASTPRPKK